MTERLTRSSVVGLQMQQKSFSSVPTMARLSWILVVCIVLIQVSLGEDATVFQTTTTVSDGTTTTTTTTTKTKKLDLAEDAPTETTKTEEVQSAIPLTARDFGSSVGDGNRWLLEFYSPHCGHCEAFAPTYSAIAKAYHGSSDHNHNIKVAKIDGSSETALSSRFGVYAYPSFYLVDGWSVYAYNDVRTMKKMMAFVEGGYRKQAPIPFYSSPMGPVGVAQGLAISSGIILADFFEGVQHKFGLSPVLVGVAMFGVVFYGCFFTIVALALLVKPKRKRD